MQISESITVGIVAERRKLASPWAEYDWRPHSVLPQPPALEPGSKIAAEEGRDCFYLGPLDLTLHRRETESYKLNLSMDRRLYIALRHGEGPGGLPVHAFQVTAAPDEGQSWAEAGDDVVDGVAMPEPIAEWLNDFVARFHVDQPKYKRKRTEVDTEVFARRDGARQPGGRR